MRSLSRLVCFVVLSHTTLFFFHTYVVNIITIQELMAESEDLADFDDHEMEEDRGEPSSSLPSTPQTSDTTFRGARRGGWGQVTSSNETSQPRKREELMFERPSSSGAQPPRNKFHSNQNSNSRPPQPPQTPVTRMNPDERALFNTVVVGRMPDDVSMSSLVAHFEKFGNLAEVVMEREKNQAFVRFENHQSALNASRAPFQMIHQRLHLSRVKRQSNPLGDVLELIQAQQQPLTVVVEQLEPTSGANRASATTASFSSQGNKPDAQAQKALLRVRIEEKSLSAARRALENLADGMKLAKEKLEHISKDPESRKEVLGEVSKFAQQIKEAQAKVQEHEAKHAQAKKELEEFSAKDVPTKASPPPVSEAE